MKTLEQLTLEEQRGLAISILREELDYKWLAVSLIMDKPPTTCKRYYKKFQNVYVTDNKTIHNGTISSGEEI